MSSPGTTAIPDGITAARSQHAGTKKSQVSHLVDFLVFHGMATDAEDARCLIRKGSVSINGVAVSSEHCRLFPGDVITRDFAWHPPFCAPLVDGIPVKPRDPITVTVDADFDAVLAQRHGERLEIVTGQSGVSGFMNGIRPPTLADAQNTHAMVMRLFANARRLNAKIKALRGATTGAAGSKARQKGQPRG
ncbi:RNA-binding S4 domain-containing protein [Komagataeibacter europaeus]|nr:hypothetical protein [Komagataeibacter europaeus]GBQ39028.1 hypothetical protein AA18890_0333 [Komagataeibacter europaeus LMG 18890]